MDIAMVACFLMGGLQPLSYLCGRKFSLKMPPSSEAFPEWYMQKADSIYNRLTRPYTLMDAAFLRDYLDYYNEKQSGWRKI